MRHVHGACNLGVQSIRMEGLERAGMSYKYLAFPFPS